MKAKKNIKNKFWCSALLLLQGFTLLMLVSCPSYPINKEYDGVWFLGFNLHKDTFLNPKTREAIDQAIDKNYIVKNIIKGNLIPIDVIPFGMPGYISSSKQYSYNIQRAKDIIKSSDINTADPILKNMVLLHTDGVITKKIASTIKKNLAQLGINVTLKEISYENPQLWAKELRSDKYHMFLMGYKSSNLSTLFIGDKTIRVFHMPECKKIPAPSYQEFFTSYNEAINNKFSPCQLCNPQKEPRYDSYDLLKPLFYSKGEANFTYFNNPRVDFLLEQIEGMDSSLKEERILKYREINSIISKEKPVIPLFYIPKL